MNCKKCGAFLVQGQTICSNCDEYNGTLQDSTGAVSNESQYSAGMNVTPDMSAFNQNGNYNNNMINNDTVYPNSIEVEKEKKKFPVWVIFLILGIVLLPIIVLGVIFITSVFTVSSTMSSSKDRSFVDGYRMLERDVRTKIIGEDIATCNSNCSNIYEYDEEDINFTVEDLGLFYKITYEAMEDGIYSNIKLTEDSCSSFSDSTCSEKRIVGRIYKN